MSKPALPASMSKPKPASKTSQALQFAEGNKADTTRLNANIRVELHRALKARAAMEGRTIGDLIEEWIEGFSKR
jgi:hypothetical protein